MVDTASTTASNTVEMTNGSTFSSLSSVIVDTVQLDNASGWSPAAIGGIVGAGLILVVILCVALVATCIVMRRRLAIATANPAAAQVHQESGHVSPASNQYHTTAPLKQTSYIDSVSVTVPLTNTDIPVLYGALGADEASERLPTK